MSVAEYPNNTRILVCALCSTIKLISFPVILFASKPPAWSLHLYTCWYLYTEQKRNAYSISHGFIFKVNKKTYYVKSIKIKNIYQQSLSHFGMLEWYHNMTIPWFVQMLISRVSTVGIKRGLHTACHRVNKVIYCHLRDVVPFLK